MAAIQEWLRNYYAMWSQHLMIQTPTLVVMAFIYSELRVCVWGGGGVRGVGGGVDSSWS